MGRSDVCQSPQQLPRTSQATPSPASRLPQLPAEIVSLVLEAAHCQDGGPAVLKTALRVNKTFYLLAAPILYREPVVYDLTVFFLGAFKHLPLHFHAIEPGAESDLLYIEHGNTKLPLLRHLRRLIACPMSIPRPGNSMMATRLQVQSCWGQLWSRLLIWKSNPEAMVPAPFLPHFATIALDPIALTLPGQGSILIRDIWETVEDSLSRLYPILFSVGAVPKSVCYDDSQPLSLSDPNLWYQHEYMRGVLPTIIYRHTKIVPDYGNRMEVVWGTRNKIYVDWAFHQARRDSLSPPWLSDAPQPAVEGAMRQEDAVMHICEALEANMASFEVIGREWEDVIDDTDVEVYGIEQVVAFERDQLPELDEREAKAMDAAEYHFACVDEDTRMRRMGVNHDLRRMEKRVVEELRGNGWPDNLCPRVRLLRRDQAPPCPCCGRMSFTKGEVLGPEPTEMRS